MYLGKGIIWRGWVPGIRKTRENMWGEGNQNALYIHDTVKTPKSMQKSHELKFIIACINIMDDVRDPIVYAV